MAQSSTPSPALHNRGPQVDPRPAVLIVNLGTPEAATAKKVRPYLREFLSDRRVIEMSPALWRPILEGIILRVRPKDSAEKYASIWTPEGSPLMHWTLRQRDELAERLGQDVEVRVAMRYGKPGIQSELDRLYKDGFRKVLIFPLYPQYAASSAGTVVDEVARWTLAARDQLEIRTIRSFPEAPAYVDALCSAIEKSWSENGRPDFQAGDKLITSFHGIPKAMHEGGDPYRYECEATAARVRERLGLTEDQLMVTFQSVFGPAEWLKPATIDTVEELGKNGTRRVDVICPGFMADCLETLEEINILNRDTFTGAGGSEFHYIPWANDSEGCINVLEEQVAGRVAGW